jgi:hypothetical protein
MKFHTATRLAALLFCLHGLSSTASADERCRLPAAITSAAGPEQIAAALDAEPPRFWAELDSAGRQAATRQIWNALADDEADRCERGRTLVDRALRMAAVNQALAADADTAALVTVLSPELEEDLGYGHGTWDGLLNAVAEELRQSAGDGFASLEQFETAYREAVENHWSGH